MRQCPNCGTEVQEDWEACPKCSINLYQAERALGRNFYLAPGASANATMALNVTPKISSKTKDSPARDVLELIGMVLKSLSNVSAGDVLRSIWVVVVGGFGLGMMGIAVAIILGLMPRSPSEPFITLIVGGVIGWIGTAPSKGTKNEMIRGMAGLIALCNAFLVVWSNMTFW
jgi:hypothetical protein